MPGYTCVAMRTKSGRSIVLWQNGIDMHNLLASDDPFVQAALAL
jgi:D-alanyl-D-alanine carboxypeptidase